MKIHKLSYRLVRAFVLFVGVLGAITLFTNTSFTGGQTVASADVSSLDYDTDTKTLTIGPGDLPGNFTSQDNVSSAETIVFVSAETSVNKVVAPQDSHQLFNNLINLKRFQGMQNFDTSQVTDMWGMFYNCMALTQLDLSGFDTSKVTNMRYMFYGCNGLTSVDLSGFNTSQVTNMNFMFNYCTSLTQLNLRGFNTSQVTTMSSMFSGCNRLTSIDLRGFNTSQVTSMEGMFYGCNGLTSVDLSRFDTSKVTNMYTMFYNCKALTQLDVSGFNTSQVTTMVAMFYGCNGLTSVDLSAFDTSKVTNMNSMFYNCKALTQLDLRGFNTSKVTNMNSMFGETTALWKLTLGNDFVFNGNNTGLLNPVVGTPFQQNLKVNSTKWLHKTGGSDLSPEGDYEYTAAEIHTAHVQGYTDTYVWQGDLGNTTVEYVVQPTYTITIPATITIPSATVAGTGNVTLSAYPKVPYENRFIHISATSDWHLTTTGDATGAEYNFSAEGGVNLKAGSALVLEADGEAPAITKTVSASLTDNAHKFKYAGNYMDTVTFTIQTAAT